MLLLLNGFCQALSSKKDEKGRVLSRDLVTGSKQ